MPVIIPNNLPAAEVLASENIFTMPVARAVTQDIRPLRIGILNLMPTKIVTEAQLLRLIGNTPLQVEVILLHPQTYASKNTPADHLSAFYQTFAQVRHKRFDGFIVTGAPVELMDFERVDYWEELQEIFAWTQTHVHASLYICWGAQAALHHFYGIPKIPLPQKCSGVFSHQLLHKNAKLLRGFDETFFAPHSRHTGIRREDVEHTAALELLSTSDDAGVYLAQSRDNRQVFITGHPEYDPDTLRLEYLRDKERGERDCLPRNYFQDDDPSRPILSPWRAHATLLFANWLNYYVYQETPYGWE